MPDSACPSQNRISRRTCRSTLYILKVTRRRTQNFPSSICINSRVFAKKFQLAFLLYPSSPKRTQKYSLTSLSFPNFATSFQNVSFSTSMFLSISFFALMEYLSMNLRGHSSQNQCTVPFYSAYISSSVSFYQSYLTL